MVVSRVVVAALTALPRTQDDNIVLSLDTEAPVKPPLISMAMVSLT